MKNRFTTLMSCFVIVLLLFNTMNALAAKSPNYGTNTHNDMELYYIGYVQCQPSFVENGKNAARGYIRYWRYDLLGNRVNDTGRLYTPYGHGPNDSRLMSRGYVYRDSIIPNLLKTQFRYGFDWVPAESGIWPINTSPI